jgi:hypothetical protein
MLAEKIFTERSVRDVGAIGDILPIQLPILRMLLKAFSSFALVLTGRRYADHARGLPTGKSQGHYHSEPWTLLLEE